MPIQRWSERIWVAKLGPDPGLSEDIDALQRQITGDGTTPDLVIDLSGVVHLNSSHLSKLLRLRKGLTHSDSRLRLAAPNDAIWAIFLATGLDKIFEFSSNTTTALADLQIDPAT